MCLKIDKKVNKIIKKLDSCLLSELSQNHISILCAAAIKELQMGT